MSTPRNLLLASALAANLPAQGGLEMQPHEAINTAAAQHEYVIDQAELARYHDSPLYFAIEQAGFMAVRTAAEMRAIGDDERCEVTPLDRSAIEKQAYKELDPYYTKICWTLGIPIVAADNVTDISMISYANGVKEILGPYPTIVSRLIDNNFRIAVLGKNKLASEIPEYKAYAVQHPENTFEFRAYSAVQNVPVLTIPEDNMGPTQCTDADMYKGEEVLSHELGHSVIDLAITPYDNGETQRKIEALYSKALNIHARQNSYALKNPNEYFAESVQAFFNSGRLGFDEDGRGNGFDSKIYNNETLQTYDPEIYSLISSIFTQGDTRRQIFECIYNPVITTDKPQVAVTILPNEPTGTK